MAYQCKGMKKNGHKCRQKVSGCQDHIFCEDWFCRHHQDQVRDLDQIQREVTELKDKMEKLQEEKKKLEEDISLLRAENDPHRTTY